MIEELHAGGRRYLVGRARRDDLRGIVALIREDPIGSARETDEQSAYAAAFERIDADPAHLLVAVRDEQDAVVGTMQLTLVPTLARAAALRLQVEAVHVAASERGAGLGGAMMAWAEDWGRTHGARLAQLTSDRRRTDAHRFYERLGYVASHVGMKRDL